MRRRAFEDTSFKYVRADLHVSEAATLRQAAADVVKVLGGLGSDSENAKTSVALEYIGDAIMDASRGRVEKQGCGGSVPLRGCHSSRRDPGGTSGSAC